MKAVIFDPEKVAPTIGEWPNPTAGPGEVVIRVHAAALNHRDLNITRPSPAAVAVTASPASSHCVRKERYWADSHGPVHLLNS